MVSYSVEGTVQEFKRTIVLGEGEAGIRLEVPASLNKSLWQLISVWKLMVVM